MICIQQYDTVLSRSDGSVHPIYCELLWCWDPTFLGVLVGLVQTNPALHKPRGNLQSPRLQKQLAKWASLMAHPMVQILIKTDQPTPGYRREIRTVTHCLFQGIRGYPQSFYEPIPFNLIQSTLKPSTVSYGFHGRNHNLCSTKVLGEAGLGHRLQRLGPVDVGVAEVEIEDGDLVKRETNAENLSQNGRISPRKMEGV